VTAVAEIFIGGPCDGRKEAVPAGKMKKVFFECVTPNFPQFERTHGGPVIYEHIYCRSTEDLRFHYKESRLKNAAV
jgi:hypothetical protein